MQAGKCKNCGEFPYCDVDDETVQIICHECRASGPEVSILDHEEWDDEWSYVPDEFIEKLTAEAFVGWNKIHG